MENNFVNKRKQKQIKIEVQINFKLLPLYLQQYTTEQLDEEQPFEHSRTSPKCCVEFLLNTKSKATFTSYTRYKDDWVPNKPLHMSQFQHSDS